MHPLEKAILEEISKPLEPDNTRFEGWGCLYIIPRKTDQ